MICADTAQELTAAPVRRPDADALISLSLTHTHIIIFQRQLSLYANAVIQIIMHTQHIII